MTHDAEDDEAHLDRVLAQFLDDVAAGRAPDVGGACEGREHLRAEIEDLARTARDAAPCRPSSRPNVGGYEIVEEIGRGGMGHVYLAVDARLGRSVALKVLPPRAGGRDARERFDREVRAVARLEHPGIVRVYGSGEDAGQPWFAMEHVRGRTLAAVVSSLRDAGGTDARALAEAFGGAVPERLRGLDWPRAAAILASDVAEALAFAHAHGVVHRDVKPSNVIVRQDGRALLFDFGLADVATEASLTISGDFLGTPHYASPEQAAGGAAAAGPATDVWSLGATLYEMLTLRLPFPGPTAHAILSSIRTDDPVSPREAAPGIPRDLETIVLAAIEKEVARRYASADAMRADLAAFLDGRPVGASRVGPAGRVLRFARRRPAFATSLALAFLLVAGVPTALWLQQRDAIERITKERDRVASAREFLSAILSSVDPAGRGADARVLDVLLDAEKRLATSFDGDEETRATLAASLGAALTEIGQYEAAARTLRPALDGLVRAKGAASASTIQVRSALVRALDGLGDHAAAIDAADAWLAACAALPPGDRMRIQAGHDRAFLDLETDPAAAARRFREVLPHARSSLGEREPLTLRILHNLAIALDGTGDDAEGLATMRAAWEGRRDALGESDAETLSSLSALAQWVAETEGDAAAEPLMLRSLEGIRALRGETHFETVVALHNLAGLRSRRNDRAAAAELQARAVASAESGAMAAGSPMDATVHLQYGRILTRAGRDADAVAALRAAVARTSAATDHDPADVVRLRVALVESLCAARLDGEAETEARALLTPDAFGPDLADWRAQTLRVLASVLDRNGRANEAAALRAEADAADRAADPSSE